jgi:GntR family transcriptional regulator
MQQQFTKNIINKNSAVPMYFQLYSYLETLMKEGKLKEGDRLPGEEEMALLLEISRPTVRQAYKELSSKGYIKRQRSKGTIVTKPKIFSKFLSELTTFYDELAPEGIQVQTKVLKFEILESTGEEAKVLGNNKLIHLARLRFSDHIPVVHIDSYLSYEKYKGLFQYDLEQESLYEKMKEVGEAVVGARRNLTAVKASKKIAQYLEMEEGDPVMKSRTIGKDSKENAVEYSIAHYNSAYSNFQIDVKLE